MRQTHAMLTRPMTLAIAPLSREIVQRLFRRHIAPILLENSSFGRRMLLVLALALDAVLPSHASHRDLNFVPTAAGDEVEDRELSLVWKSCVEGMSWNGHTCTGQPLQLTIEAAFAHAQAQSDKTGLPWRLPCSNELNALTQDHRNYHNEAAFPATPRLFYWAASFYSMPDVWRIHGYANGGNGAQGWRPLGVHLVRSLGAFGGCYGVGGRVVTLQDLREAESLRPKSPASRYDIRGDEVYDGVTGLTWKRCKATLSGDCSGRPDQPWSQIDALNGTGNGWRLLTRAEVETLFLPRPHFLLPGYDTFAFPGDRTWSFWTQDIQRNAGMDVAGTVCDLVYGCKSFHPNSGSGQDYFLMLVRSPQSPPPALPWERTAAGAMVLKDSWRLVLQGDTVVPVAMAIVRAGRGGPYFRRIFCASYNHLDCLLGLRDFSKIDIERLDPRFCGDIPQRVQGETDYGSEAHWCTRALRAYGFMSP